MKHLLLTLTVVAFMACNGKQEAKAPITDQGIGIDFTQSDYDSMMQRTDTGLQTIWVNPKFRKPTTDSTWEENGELVYRAKNARSPEDTIHLRLTKFEIDSSIAYVIKDPKSKKWGVYAKDFFDAETWGGVVVLKSFDGLFVARESNDFYDFKSKMEADSICQKYTLNYIEYSKTHAADQKEQAKLNNHFKADSSIAYIKYNPKIKKYAVWARNYEGNDAWNYLFRTWQGSLFLTYSDKPFDLYSTKEEALKVCEEYTQNYKRYAKSHATQNQRTGFQ